MWLGYLERGGVGAPAGIVPFVLVPFLLVMAAGVVYARYQGLTVVQDVRFGVGPAVLAIIAIASYKLARATKSGAIAGVAIVIGRQTLEGPLSITIGICALALLLQPWRELPQPMLVGVAAATGLLLH
jgi:chromate transporter